MSVKKTIKDEFNPLYSGFNRLATDIRVNLDSFSHKLDAKKDSRLKRAVIALRNWISFILLCVILFVLLHSCFVSGRTIHVATPRVDISADTATAFTIPYHTEKIHY